MILCVTGFPGARYTFFAILPKIVVLLFLRERLQAGTGDEILEPLLVAEGRCKLLAEGEVLRLKGGNLEVLLFKPTAKLLLELLLRVAVVAWEEKSPSTTIITELDVNGSKLTKNVV